MIPKEQRVLYLDPLGERQPDLKRCQEVTRSFMNEKGIHVSTWACDTLPHPHQKDSSSCGAFVLKKLRDKGSSDLPSVGYRSSNRVFSEEQEKVLAEYLTQAADLYYGLAPREVRTFAYELAVKYDLKYPQTWGEKQMAGPDWFTFFMKRNPNLSMRSPEATSLTRATSFNHMNVERFFNNFGQVIKRYNFDGSDIWNMDETGVTTVQSPDRVVARRGVKQVGAMTSGERVKAIDFCKKKGIVLLAFPPHCNHKLQPLDRSVYGPFKKMVNTASDAWMKMNPAKTVTIYDIPRIVKTAMPTAATPKNITAGFVSTGIWPFNPDIFQECDYAPSQVTDRPDPGTSLTSGASQLDSPPTHSGTTSSPPTYLGTTSSPPPTYLGTASSPPAHLGTTSSPPAHLGTTSSPPTYLGTTSSPPTYLVTSGSSAIHNITMSCAPDEPGTSGLSPGQAFSPSAMQPFPKAGPRKTTGRIRKKRRSEILTDTPVKQALMEEQQGRGKKIIVGKKKGKKQKKERKPTKKMLNFEDSDISDEENFCVVCMEPYGNSKPKEVWVKCALCSLWAHKACSPGLPAFICQHCDSD
ncbi:unnamed protein product [Leuciscus chuanchicus]